MDPKGVRHPKGGLLAAISGNVPPLGVGLRIKKVTFDGEFYAIVQGIAVEVNRLRTLIEGIGWTIQVAGTEDLDPADKVSADGIITGKRILRTPPALSSGADSSGDDRTDLSSIESSSWSSAIVAALGQERAARLEERAARLAAEEQAQHAQEQAQHAQEQAQQVQEQAVKAVAAALGISEAEAKARLRIGPAGVYYAV